MKWGPVWAPFFLREARKETTKRFGLLGYRFGKNDIYLFMARKARGQPTWSPSKADFEQVWTQQNPWLATGEVPSVLVPPTERVLGQELWRSMLREAPRRFYLVVGPRRVGKTTCLYQTVAHLLRQGISRRRIWWLRLDHPLLMDVSLGRVIKTIVDASKATVESPVYVFLDELTYSNKWEHWLKTFYDEAWPVRIAASSSATAALRQGKHESGVGRWDEIYLPPYSFSEYLQLLGRPWEVPAYANLHEAIETHALERIDLRDCADDRRRFLLTGGFPELLLAGANRPSGEYGDMFLRFQSRLRDDAVTRAIYMDIPQTFSIENPALLERLLYTLGGQVTGILSPTNIGGDLGMTRPTFDKYLSYLEQASLVFTTQSYAHSERSVQKRGRKLYFVDGAVRNAALQRGPLPLTNPEEEGLMLENAVASHLHTLAQLRQSRLYYWHEDAKSEVDLLLDDPPAPIALEIGRGAQHHRRSLLALARRHTAFKGRSYLVSPDSALASATTSEEGIGTVPLDLMLAIIGAQAQAALRVRLGG